MSKQLADIMFALAEMPVSERQAFMNGSQIKLEMDEHTITGAIIESEEA